MPLVDSEIAYAKINLALHVRARRPDGYHDIETLFAFADTGDLLTVEEADGLSLDLVGEFGGLLPDGEGNLVIRAAEALRERFDIADGAALRLDKRLPVAAGIGGGSADAAAALRLLARFWHVPASPEVLADIAEGLGADVPACIESVTVRGEGTGTMLLPADGAELSGLPVLLVNPRVACPTGQVFAAWGGEDRGALGKGSPLAAAHRGRNDLEPPAVALVPEIKGVLEQLRGSAGITLARMSGSGATCFGLFVSDTARDRAASFFPGCWVMAANLR